MKKILAYRNYLVIYCLIELIFNLLLLQAPLANTFSYEFSLLNAFLITLLSGIYFVSLLKKIRNNKQSETFFVKQILPAFVILLAIPLAVSLTNALICANCPVMDGAKFYTAITFPSVLVGFALALFCVYVFKKFYKIFFLLIFFLILSVPVAEFYFNPQIYFYNPVAGFYPGTIYDEGLKVSSTLVMYRILNVIYFGVIAFVLYRCIIGLTRLRKLYIVLPVVFIAVLFIYLSPYLGFSTTFSRMESELKGTAVTKHFIIHYPAQLNKDLVKAIVVYQEYNYAQLKEFFGYEYSQKINSYLFLNGEQKKVLFGSANADFAKPWMNSTFITYNEYGIALKHETAHCFAALIGTGPLKVSAGLNPYLTEGMAVAADPVIDGNNVDYLASVAYSNKYKANLDGLFDKFSFFTQSSLLSYIYAGSFSRYLIRVYGMSKFEKLYSDGDFTGIYGKKLHDVVQDYYSTLSDTALLNRADEAKYYFGRKSIFYKVCPRYIQEKVSEGWKYFNDKNYPEAKKTFGDILSITNDYSAITGYANCLQKIDSAGPAVRYLQSQIGQFKNSAYFYSLELKLGDMLVMNNKFADGDSIYKSLISQNPNQLYYYLASMRSNMLTKDSLLARYLNGNDFDKYNILKEYNSVKYDYSSIPVLLDLADNFDSDYNLAMGTFSRVFDSDNYTQSYALYKLSNYMLSHLDFERARKIAALALRVKTDTNFDFLLKSNYEKAIWFYQNYKSVLSNVIYSYN